jgi:hypothetical protein
MSNKQTAVEEAIHLIKQDYEANGRLRLAFVLQTLNKAKEKEKQQIIDAYMGGTAQFANDARIDYPKTPEQYYTETYAEQSNEQ